MKHISFYTILLFAVGFASGVSVEAVQKVIDDALQVKPGLSGTVTDETGKPLAGVRVSDGFTVALTSEEQNIHAAAPRSPDDGLRGGAR
jgi:hypothetical protein